MPLFEEALRTKWTSNHLRPLRHLFIKNPTKLLSIHRKEDGELSSTLLQTSRSRSWPR
ncbi:hypothetical protein AALP_AA6G244000 [Arabis alpina]|uniref:Uncharacterized protein n=1 Tax=Arabis alpina TaxID=50452 RepID=A0A087GRF2_ARAAL|nr:hypothetical protein AALP_AA6G244000 [Arabis alpina]